MSLEQIWKPTFLDRLKALMGLIWSLLTLLGPRFAPRVNHLSEAVVCLTTVPSRISHVWLTIESLMRQTVSPMKVILVLSEEEFRDILLPRSLIRLENRGLEIIRDSGNRRSYKKLLPALERFPQSPVITVDDDAIYSKFLVQELLNEIHSNPNCVIGSRGRKIQVRGGGIEQYASWPLASGGDQQGIFLTGVGGVIYPPSISTKSQILAYPIAEKLCPFQDDVWFWSAAIAAGYRHRVSKKALFSSLPWAGGQPLSLTNLDPSGNDKSILATLRHYKIPAGANLLQ